MSLGRQPSIIYEGIVLWICIILREETIREWRGSYNGCPIGCIPSFCWIKGKNSQFPHGRNSNWVNHVYLCLYFITFFCVLFSYLFVALRSYFWHITCILLNENKCFHSNMDAILSSSSNSMLDALILLWIDDDNYTFS